MRRVLLALALLFFTFDVSGLFTAAVVIAEEAHEDGDECADECNPACDDCMCCFHPRVMITAAPPAAASIAPVSAPASETPARLAEPHPREIFHVPKARA